MRDLLRGCFLCGLPVTALLMLCTAALLTAADLPFSCYGAVSAVPLLCGCFAAGYVTGRSRRHHGLHCGFSAALLLSLLRYAAGCVLAGKVCLPLFLLLTLPCGICGGIFGVNTRLPLPKRRSHDAAGIRERMILRSRTRRRPEPQDSSDAAVPSETKQRTAHG